MNDQNVNNFGDNNTSNQYNGDVTLYSLDLEGLALEDHHAERVVRSSRRRRSKVVVISSLVALASLVAGYVFYLNRGDLTLADIFNNFGSAIAGPLLGILVSGLVAFISGALASASVRSTELERDNMNRRAGIQHIALSKGFSPKEWSRAKKAVRKDT